MTFSKFSFAVLEGSLIDLVNREIPNWSRSSPVHLERSLGSSIQFNSVSAFLPAFDPEEGHFLLEPNGTNLLTWNLAVNNSVWQKGSNVVVRSDVAIAPDATLRGDRVTWTSGTGNSQLIRRSFTNLEAGTEYFLTFVSRLQGGGFGPNDFLRVVGGVAGTFQSTLSALNAYMRNYRLMTLAFTTAGSQPKLPGVENTTGYTLTAVTTNTFTLTGLEGVAINDLVGATITFSNVAGKTYLVTANTASSGSQVVITIATSTLLSDGVTTAASTATISAAPLQSVNIELYCESTASIDWGGMQLEQRDFRTSMIYQGAETLVRSASTLTYRTSPIDNLPTFGIYLSLAFWRGDGNLIDFGDVRASIVEGKLSVTVGNTTLNDPSLLPTTNANIFIQLSSESASLNLFVNNKLVARTSVVGFRSTSSTFTLTSSGVRAIRQVLISTSLLLDGQPEVNGMATQEVADLFNRKVVNPGDIGAIIPTLNLPTITIPAPESPIGRTIIDGINTSTRVLTVRDGTNFAIGSTVQVLRGTELAPVLFALVTAKTGNSITLDTVAGIVIGDVLNTGNYNRPGRASIRFPASFIDTQIINSIDVPNRRLSVNSALSFQRQRAFIWNPDTYQDVSEVVIEAIDTINNTLTISSLTGVSVGNVIGLPFNELLIDPSVYSAELAMPLANVQISQKTRNAIVITNTRNEPVQVTPLIRPFL